MLWRKNNKKSIYKRSCQKGWFLPSLFVLLVAMMVDGKKTATLIFGGDVTFSGIIKYLVDEGRCTYNESFKKLKPYLKEADYVVVNLETVIRTDDSTKWLRPPPEKDIHLTSDASSLGALTYAGINAVSVANNHMNDLGASGVVDTLNLLLRNNIGKFGYTFGKSMNSTQYPLIIEKNGIKIGILGYCEARLIVERLSFDNAGAAPFNVTLAVQESKTLKKNGCDIVILFMHWADEYVNVAGIEQFTYIKDLVRKGSVDVIVGSHPHVTMQHFYMGKTLIVPSMGNLLFPSHYSCARNFVFEDRNVSMVEKYVKVWETQSRLLKNPTSYGRLIKVVVNRDGIIPSKTKYLETQVLPAHDKPCLMVDKKEGSPSWRKICGKDDSECMSTPECNAIHCRGMDAYPDLIPPYSTKDKN